MGGRAVFTIVCPESVIADPPSWWRAGLPVEMVCRQVKLMLKQAVMIIIIMIYLIKRLMVYGEKKKATRSAKKGPG